MNSEARLSETGYDDAESHDEEPPSPRGFFGRVFHALTGAEDQDEAEGESERHVAGAPGLVNLRRMRVDDVAIPKVEIIARGAQPAP